MDPVDSVLTEGRVISDDNNGEAGLQPLIHTEETVDAVLAHYGKKGMKWGVRNDRGHEGEAVKTKKLAKLDKQWEKENTGQKAWVRAYNAAADKMNSGGIDKLNNEPEFKKAADDGILLDPTHPTTQKYYKAHEDAMHEAMIESWAAIGKNPSGTKEFKIQEVESPDGNYRDVFLVDVDRKLKHADETDEADEEPDTDFAFRLERDRRGLVTKYVLVKGELSHSETTDDYIAHVDERSWSQYSESDYSVEQWHRACLIHEHTGDPTSKAACKLPVKTPDGQLNRNGVHAAAAALGGARGGVKASEQAKTMAAKALVKLYAELDEDPPEGLLKHEDAESFVGSFLAHYGVKGMKWGVTTKRDRSPTEVTVEQKKPGTFVKSKGGTNLPASEDAVRAATARQKANKSTTDALSNKELQDLVNRMNLEQQYSRLKFESDRRSKGQRFIAGLLGKKRYDRGDKNKRRFTDSQEQTGEAVRKVIDWRMDQAKKREES